MKWKPFFSSKSRSAGKKSRSTDRKNSLKWNESHFLAVDREAPISGQNEQSQMKCKPFFSSRSRSAGVPEVLLKKRILLFHAVVLRENSVNVQVDKQETGRDHPQSVAEVIHRRLLAFVLIISGGITTGSNFIAKLVENLPLRIKVVEFGTLKITHFSAMSRH